MSESWKDVPGYEGIYQVSDHGRLKSVPHCDRRGHPWPERIHSPGRCHGYAQVILSRDRNMRKEYVHTLVLTTFVGPRPPGKQCNHKNGDKWDNRLENLEYCTASENHFHAYQQLGKQAARGSKQGSAKLTETEVLEIRRLAALGGIQFQKLAELFGVSPSNITMIVQRKRWKHI